MVKKSSKYYRLYTYLRESTEDKVTLTFGEIESIVLKKLPASARTKRAWWSNRKRGAAQAAAWMMAGYHIVAIDLAAEEVTFRKPGTGLKVEWDGDTLMWNGELIKALRYHMGLSQEKMAEKLGVRQQTISEWETSVYVPKRLTCKYLMLVAEQVRFEYGQ